MTPPNPPTNPRNSPPVFGNPGQPPEDRSCWCGETNPYYAPVPRHCDGYGHITCLCGGDFCVCHHHGEAECFGCPECESDEDEDDYE